MNQVYIVGNIKPGNEDHALAEIDRLLHEIESPAILYYGDDHTAATLRQYSNEVKTNATSKGEASTAIIPMFRDMDQPHRTNSRTIAAEHLIILGYPIGQAYHAHKTRTKIGIGQTAVILPYENPRPHAKRRQTIYPTGYKSNRRRRRRLPAA